VRLGFGVRLRGRLIEGPNNDFLFGSGSPLRFRLGLVVCRRCTQTIPGDRRSGQRCIAAVARYAAASQRGSRKNKSNALHSHRGDPFARAATYDFERLQLKRNTWPCCSKNAQGASSLSYVPAFGRETLPRETSCVQPSSSALYPDAASNDVRSNPSHRSMAWHLRLQRRGWLRICHQWTERWCGLEISTTLALYPRCRIAAPPRARRVASPEE
jgi:hypothetical protein